MSALGRSAHMLRARSGALAAHSSSTYGRTASYRRLADIAPHAPRQSSQTRLLLPSSIVLRSAIRQQDVLTQTYTISSHHFSTQTPFWQKAQKDDVKTDGPKPQPEQEAKADEKTSEAKAEGEEQGKEESGKEEKTKKEGKDEEPPPPPPHGNKTPWQVFTETLQSEFKASKEWNESTKALSSGYQDFTQNPALQKAKSSYSQAADAAGKTTTSAARAIGKGAAWTWDTGVVKGVRKGVSATGRGIEQATRPIRQTEAYKSVEKVIDDGSSSRYGGWVEKEERRKKREAREAEMGGPAGTKSREPAVEDPEAGTNVTLHKDAAWKESWRDFRDNSPLMNRLFTMKTTYNESENPLITTARSITDRFAGFFAENETAMVIKKFREMDPTFQIEPFLTEMREYILPEVLDAYVKGDVETLKLWLSAAQYSVYAALMTQYTTAGLKSDGRILDIRNVDILTARLLDPGEVPVFVVTCRTQEVHVYRNAKSNELAAGMDDKVQQVTYAIGVTRVPEDVANPETRGWKFIELQKSARDYI